MTSVPLFRSAIVGAFLAGGLHANAQLVAPDVFIQGSYVEVGVTDNGDYGTSAAPPAGYHSHLLAGVGLGFVCDYGKDGWTTGVPPFMGDYFLPGSPFEGWELQVDTGRCQAFNDGTGRYVGSYAGSGSNTAYTVSGSTRSGTWQGMVDSIAITQVTTIDTLNLFFTVKITLTNTSHAVKNDIYYLRTIDPDNDETWPGGSFYTHQEVTHQVPDTTVVQAIGRTGINSLMALGTTDTPATALVYNDWPLPATVDLSKLYNKTYSPASYSVGLDDPGDIAIALVIKVAHLASVDSMGDSVARATATHLKHPANSASFSYFYAFTSDGVDSAISSTIRAKANDTVVTTPPSGSTLSVKNINAGNEIKVYPNPSKDVINVTGLNAGDQVAIFDLMGKKVEQNWPVNGSDINTFPMANVPSGAYIVVVTDADGNAKARVPVRKL